ncbi:MAG: hypothetical protein MI802_15845 [Desulfobacterales bacterium]|nr:hypothetical protein [Desulfobacterales bacterium]
MTVKGYLGKMARIDLSSSAVSVEELSDDFIRKWVGGQGFGSKILWDEVPADVAWDDPENRMVWTSGPLAGTGVYGAGTFNVAAKGPLSGLAGCSQANGYFGAYLKFSGFDGLIFQGKAPQLSYMVIKDGQIEIKDATHLAGLDLFELEDKLRAELGVKGAKVSIYGIGPAGESKVHYASIGGDQGHFAAHNGLGAVMGSKNLKAVVAYKGPINFDIEDPATLKTANEEMFEFAKEWGHTYKWGTAGGVSFLAETGGLPVKNFTTNIYPEHDTMNGQYMRTNYKHRPKPCYKCKYAHVRTVEVTEGPYKGFVGEEPEYEQVAAWGPQIGNTELGAVVMLAREVDRLGLDCNEASWTVGWVMECYDKGILSQTDLDGLDLSWGNVEAVRELLCKIAARDGFGEFLAQGVKVASQKLGGEAADMAIYTHKGSSPRSHDHRGGKWAELLDTCASNTSTIESTWVGVHPQLVDMDPQTDPFDPKEVGQLNGDYNGVRPFDDCMGTCRFVACHPKLQLACLNAVTGWELTLKDVFTVGRRVVNQLRMFNLRHGLTKEMERPSKRYGSKPVDGPASGHEFSAHWKEMLEDYYTHMGWTAEGIPLPETLTDLGLTELIDSLK